MATCTFHLIVPRACRPTHFHWICLDKCRLDSNATNIDLAAYLTTLGEHLRTLVVNSLRLLSTITNLRISSISVWACLYIQIWLIRYTLWGVVTWSRHFILIPLCWCDIPLWSLASWSVEKTINVCNIYMKRDHRLYYTWWRHQMETFSAWLAICAGNSPVSPEFPAQKASDAELWCFLWSAPEWTVE